MTSTCPPEVLGWIAWYPDGSLDDAQRGAVEAHAAGCTACRQELAMLEDGVEPTRQSPDPAQLLERIWQRVDAAEVEPLPVPAHARGRVGAPARPARWLSPLAAAAALLIAALAGWTLASLSGEASYRSATAPEQGAPAPSPTLDVVFAKDASAASISALLGSLDAQIVAGPSAIGRYRVQIPPGADPAAIAARLRREGGGVALLAEPTLR